MLIESFVYSNFNDCPLVWNFTGAKAINKIESVQKRALPLLFDNYESSYYTVLMKAKKSTMMVQRLRYLCAEIYRTVNGLNPRYMKKSDTLKIVSATFLLVCFSSLNENTCQTRKNVFYFISKAFFVLEKITF